MFLLGQRVTSVVTASRWVQRVEEEQIVYYKAFNLIFHSEFELPELLPAAVADMADIVIRAGKTPERLVNATAVGVRYQVCRKEVLLQVDNIARFWIRDGREIIVEAFTDDHHALRLFLLGSAMGIALQQRELLVLHGSAVSDGRVALVFCGHSGAGKSTSSQIFCRHGYRLMSDDLCVIQPSETGFVVVPSFPQNKLWPDSLEFLGIEAELLHRVRKELPKRAVPSASFCEDACALKAVFVLQPTNSPELSITKVKGIKKLDTLREQSYRSFLIPPQGLTEVHFNAIKYLADEVPVYLVHRPKSFCIAEKIISDIEAVAYAE